jgi:predicted dehydrogenase/threonine dehydrogenase-like Zn-dependent dehydrogenase
VKQILQDLRNGLVGVADVPTAKAGEGRRLIRSQVSLLSAGTERMLIEFGRAGWLEKARQQPDKVRMVIEKIRTDGLMATFESVRAKLDQPIALGYSNVGVDFETGTRLASNGPHAEVVQVPKNLCARVPDNVPDEAAAFTVLGAIALQGIRLAQPTLGETFAVMGLGLIGLLTVQILRGNGCRVVGIDPDPRRVDLARGFGAVTEGTEVDGVIITAATKNSEPVHQAAEMCRKRGRIVLVGVTGLELSRDDFYKKELSFQVSCSYGPGRYDPAYEEGGQDYPLPYVRWTAQRNFEAVLQLTAEGKLDVAPMISHRFPFERAEEAYELLLSGEPHLGILLEYSVKPDEELLRRTVRRQSGGLGRAEARPQAEACSTLALIGAGQHALRMLLPAMRQSGGCLRTVADSNGVSAAHAGRKFGFEAATTDSAVVLGDPAVDTVFIATRHDSHARLVCEALRAGKNVFVEKPLALNEQELAEIEELGGAESSGQAETCPTLLMVGFNRRFAPHIVKMKELLKGTREPKALIMTVNAGAVPADHWTLDPERGGGRIIGEACHFIDLLRFLAGSAIVSSGVTRLSGDTVAITLAFADGSTGTVHYLANGHKSFPKERLEVFCGGRILQLDNFRRLTGYGWRGFRKMGLWRQDKGHGSCVAAFLKAVREGGPSPIPFEELVEVARVTLRVAGGE